MTHADVQAWLDRYVEAWRTYDRATIEALFTEDAVYGYRPWDSDEHTVRGRTAIAALIRTVVPREWVPDPIAAAEVIQIAAQEIAVFTVGGRGHERSQAQSGALREALGSMIFRYLFAAPAPIGPGAGD